jgi:hypothetical protein
VLEAARGRILNVELKYYGDHQPNLAERVVEAVRPREALRAYQTLSRRNVRSTESARGSWSEHSERQAARLTTITRYVKRANLRM